MNYQALFDHVSLDSEIKITQNPSKLEKNISKIEKLIKKPFPVELKEFYSLCDGLDWEGNDKKESLPSLDLMFDNFKKHKKNLTYEMLEDGEIEPTDQPFYEQIWDDMTWDDLYELPEKQQKQKFEFMRRLKLLAYINGTSNNILIDFFDEKEEYKLYYQHNASAEIYPLHLDINRFYVIFCQVGFDEYWFYYYMSEADQKQLYPSFKPDFVEELFYYQVNFKFLEK